MDEMEWDEGDVIQHGETLEKFFVFGCNSSPRKADHFVDRGKETGGSTTQSTSTLYAIKRDRSISVEMDDQLFLTNVKRGRKASNEGGEHLSRRKAGELFVDIPEDQMESPLSTPRGTHKNILVHASPRVIRTQSEDGSSEQEFQLFHSVSFAFCSVLCCRQQEFQLSTPVVRHSRSLALRRISSAVFNSPQFQVTTPSPARRQSSYGSSSGPEPMSIGTDDGLGRMDSISDEPDLETGKHDETDPPGHDVFSKPSARSGGPKATRRLPFHLKRQESDLFENEPTVTANDIAFLQADDSPNAEFKLGRRRTGKSPAEGTTPASSKRTNNRDDRRADQHLPTKDQDQDLTTQQSTFPRWGRSVQQQRIKRAVETFCLQDAQVIADGSALYALPCFRGKKEELMFITSHTLADVLKGRYDDGIDHYDIIDCRYPYEYAGGHIIGALNLFRAENIGEIMSWKDKDSNKRNVLIFHCEFSSQRGPAMMRLLRNTDRRHHADCYPYLCHPEIYLLEGGYKEFYAKYSHLCEPQNYVPMVHADHANDLKKFLTRSTSWHGRDFCFSKHSQTLLI
ncbi:hypothetical protein ACOMHN_048538 [Nucella lapillus]